MVNLISQVFGVLGADISVPQTFAELIPYLIYVFVGIGFFLFILGMFRYWLGQIFGGRLL